MGKLELAITGMATMEMDILESETGPIVEDDNQKKRNHVYKKLSTLCRRIIITLIILIRVLIYLLYF